MIRRICLILYLVGAFHISLFAQQILCGRVYDSLTKQPVSYATISSSSSAVYCDSLGVFELKNVLDDSVFISCVGYESKKVNIGKSVCDTFFLSPTYKQLAPVTIGEYAWLKNPSVTIGKIEGKSKFAINVPSGLTLLKYFGNPDKSKKYIIGALSLRINQSDKDYEPRKVRVRIFEIKDGIQVGEDILNASNVFTINKTDDESITIQLNKFFVEMPENGCLVGFEFIRNGFDSNSKEYSGFLSIKGWLSKSFEDGIVFSKYFSNKFREYTFSLSQKVNLYSSLTLYEK